MGRRRGARSANQNVLALVRANDHGKIRILAEDSPESLLVREGDGSTVFHVAAREGSSQTLSFLLRHPILQDELKASMRADKSKHPLHEAAAQGQLECVKLLLDYGCCVDSHKTNGFTALHTAAAKGHLEVVMLLVTQGAEVDARNKHGETPFSIACREVGGRNLDIPRYLCQQGADINTRRVNLRTPLHSASLNGDPLMVEFLLANGADANAKEKCDVAPLHQAAASGSREVVKILIEKGGANPHDRDDVGITPLMNAAIVGAIEVMEYLLACHGDCGGWKLGGVQVDDKDNDGGTALYWACARNQLAAVTMLLGAGADANCKKKFRSALHNASEWGYSTIVQILCEHGADLSCLDHEGMTPGEVAKTEEIRSFLDKFTNPS